MRVRNIECQGSKKHGHRIKRVEQDFGSIYPSTSVLDVFPSPVNGPAKYQDASSIRGDDEFVPMHGYLFARDCWLTKESGMKTCSERR
jgi:hypothetical protein